MPSPTSCCSSYWKGSFWVILDHGYQLTYKKYIWICCFLMFTYCQIYFYFSLIYIYIYIYIYMCVCVWERKMTAWKIRLRYFISDLGLLELYYYNGNIFLVGTFMVVTAGRKWRDILELTPPGERITLFLWVEAIEQRRCEVFSPVNFHRMCWFLNLAVPYS